MRFTRQFAVCFIVTLALCRVSLAGPIDKANESPASYASPGGQAALSAPIGAPAAPTSAAAISLSKDAHRAADLLPSGETIGATMATTAGQPSSDTPNGPNTNRFQPPADGRGGGDNELPLPGADYDPNRGVRAGADPRSPIDRALIVPNQVRHILDPAIPSANCCGGQIGGSAGEGDTPPRPGSADMNLGNAPDDIIRRYTAQPYTLEQSAQPSADLPTATSEPATGPATAAPTGAYGSAGTISRGDLNATLDFFLQPNVISAALFGLAVIVAITSRRQLWLSAMLVTSAAATFVYGSL